MSGSVVFEGDSLAERVTAVGEAALESSLSSESKQPDPESAPCDHGGYEGNGGRADWCQVSPIDLGMVFLV